MVRTLLSDSGNTYEIDTDMVSCSCPHFQYRTSKFAIGDPKRMCKHLRAVFQDDPQSFPSCCWKNEAIADAVKDAQTLKYPRSMFDKYADTIRTVFLPACKYCWAAGEYRRLIPNMNPELIMVVQDQHPDIDHYKELLSMAYSNLEYILTDQEHFIAKVDGWLTLFVYFCSQGSAVTTLFHYTGSKDEVLRVRDACLKKGLDLRVNGLYESDKLLPLMDSHDLYSYAGLPYKSPWER